MSRAQLVSDYGQAGSQVSGYCGGFVSGIKPSWLVRESGRATGLDRAASCVTGRLFSVVA